MGQQTTLDGAYGSYQEYTASELTGKENYLVELGPTENSVRLLVTPGKEIGTIASIDALTRDVTVRYLRAPGEQLFIQDGAIAALGRFKGKAGGKVTAAGAADAAIGIKKSPLASSGADGDIITGLNASSLGGVLGAPSVTVANATPAPNGNAIITIQAKNSYGADYVGRVLFKVWLAATAYAAPADLGTLTATTGVLAKEDTDDALATVISDANGLAVLQLDLAADGNLYAMAEAAGNVGAGNAAITGN